MSKKWILLVCVLFMSFIPNLIGGVKGENEYGTSTDMPLEMVISRRISIHYGDYYSNVSVPSEFVSRVLWAAYGYSGNGRTVPSLYNYPTIIYFCNETAAYRFVPASQSLAVWKDGDYRQLSGGYLAPIQLYIVSNTSVCSDVLWGNAESGNAIQNIYLMANTLNLGTVCEGGTWLDREQIRQGLGLPDNEKVLYKMPLGYPLPPYVDYNNLVPTTRPSSPQLPQIQDSATSLEETLNMISSSHEWKSDSITQQELSQVLWASYGYSYFNDTVSGVQHRTVPSAHSYYPMRIYAANSTGVYKYIPELHDLTTVVTGDRRSIIASASGNNWASSAPLVVATVWDDTKILTEDTTYVEVGLITQNVYLEGVAWGLITDWGRADGNESAMKEALGLSGETHLHPASIITVGQPLVFGLDTLSTQGGTTDPLPGTHHYQAGASTNVTAIPALGYSFDHWMLDGERKTENPINITMNANYTVQAFFIDNIPPTVSAPVQSPPENVSAYQDVTVTVNVTDFGSGVSNVALSYTIDNGTSWKILNMTETFQNVYQTTIPGYEDRTFVMYKIIASDNSGTQALNNNYGHYYFYNVIPEFQNLALTLLTLMTLTSAIVAYKRKLLRVPRS